MTSTSEPPEPIREAYALERARLAGFAAAPALVYPTLAALLGASPSRIALGMGLVLFAAAGVFAGGKPARGVGLGLVFGAIPFLSATIARGSGHLCLDGACMAACVPACGAAGLVAGALTTFAVVRLRGGLAAMGSAGGLLLLAGGCACHCVGATSLAALSAGVLLTALPAAPRLLADTRA